MMTSKKIKKIKKWPREKKLELKWVQVSEHWDNLRGENPSLDSIFSIFIQPCRHPDCNRDKVVANKCNYIVVSRDNDDEVMCGTHLKMDYRICKNESCKVCN